MAVASGKLNRAVRAIADEISLLHRLLNTIRRASKESQNLKAAKLFKILDDEGNDLEQMLRECFAHNIRDQFPGLSETIRARLASTMLLRRKRILYRRSRYGKAPIKPKKTTLQPAIKPPSSVAPEQAQVSGRPESTAKTAQSIVQSLAPSATTLAADKFKRASAPSVISATKTVAFGNHEDLVFPSAPKGYVRQKYKRLEEERQREHEAYLQSLPGYLFYLEHNGKPPLDPGAVSELRQKISEAKAELQRTLERDWEDCNAAMLEVICPFCFYALLIVDVLDEKKWQ